MSFGKEEQLKVNKSSGKRRKYSLKTRLDRKLVGSNGSSGIWSRLVKLKAGNCCEVCGSTENLSAHHIEGRRNEITRYDLRNGVCLCAGCHTFGKKSAHQSPLWFNEWLKVHRNDDFYHIKTVMNEIKKWEESELQELLKEYLKLEDEYLSLSKKGV